MLMEILHEM